MPLNFQLPKSAQVETVGSRTFIKLEKTYLALSSLGLQALQSISIDPKVAARLPDEQFFQALPNNTTYSGFTLEVGESPTYANFETFKQAVKMRSHLDLTYLDQGIVTIKGATGDRLKLQYNLGNLLPKLAKNEVSVRWEDHFALYDSRSRDKAPISLGWKQGILRVKAGGYPFESLGRTHTFLYRLEEAKEE